VASVVGLIGSLIGTRLASHPHRTDHIQHATGTATDAESAT
jgi:hypothetical protein